MKRTSPQGWVVAAILFAAIIWFVLWINQITTPAICRVPVSQMNQFCIDLLFPH